MKGLLLGLTLLGLLAQAPVATAADWEYRCEGWIELHSNNDPVTNTEVIIKFTYTTGGQTHNFYKTVTTDLDGYFDARQTISNWNGPVGVVCTWVYQHNINQGDISGCEGGQTLYDRTAYLAVKVTPQ